MVNRIVSRFSKTLSVKVHTLDCGLRVGCGMLILKGKEQGRLEVGWIDGFFVSSTNDTSLPERCPDSPLTRVNCMGPHFIPQELLPLQLWDR